MGRAYAQTAEGVGEVGRVGQRVPASSRARRAGQVRVEVHKDRAGDVASPVGVTP